MAGLLVLLPPSETKRPGGTGPALDLDHLALPCLLPQREQVVAALVAASTDDETGARMLRLGPSQRGELAANRALSSAPTMPAVDRYSGVLFDALDASSLDRAGRRWLGAHVLVHSAPFGPVGALDPIPAYRMGAATSLPGLPALRRVWAEPVSAALAAASASFVLDLRSEAYVALGPVPDAVPGAWVRVVAASGRPLNHFNKHAKGSLVRALAETRPRIGGVRSLQAWADAVGWRLRGIAPRVVELEV